MYEIENLSDRGEQYVDDACIFAREMGTIVEKKLFIATNEVVKSCSVTSEENAVSWHLISRIRPRCRCGAQRLEVAATIDHFFF